MAAVLAGFVLFSLFVGTLPTAAALALCVLAGGALAESWSSTSMPGAPAILGGPRR